MGCGSTKMTEMVQKSEKEMNEKKNAGESGKPSKTQHVPRKIKNTKDLHIKIPKKIVIDTPTPSFIPMNSMKHVIRSENLRQSEEMCVISSNSPSEDGLKKQANVEVKEVHDEVIDDKFGEIKQLEEMIEKLSSNSNNDDNDNDIILYNMRLSHIYIELCHYEKAMVYCKTSLYAIKSRSTKNINNKNDDELKLQHVNAIIMLGKIFSALKKNDEAIEQYKKCLTIIPESFRALEKLGDEYLEKENFPVAKGYYKRAIASNEFGNVISIKKHGVYYNLGSCHNEVREYDEAVKCFEIAVRNYPGSYEAHNALGIVYKLLKKYTLSIEHFKKSLEIKSDNESALLRLGMIYQNQKNNFKEAEEYYKKAIMVNDESNVAHCHYGVLLKENGNHLGAKREFERAFQLDPSNDIAGTAVMYYKMSQYKDVISYIEMQLRQDPANAILYYELGSIFYTLKYWKKAKKSLEKAIENDPNNSDAYRKLSLVFGELKDEENAKDCVEKALKIEATNKFMEGM